MVDFPARTQLAELARALATGRITNDQFENALPKSKDPAVAEVFTRGFWPLYSDLEEHTLSGTHRLAPENRRWVARCVLFLKSGQPYLWPKHPRLSRWLAMLKRPLGGTVESIQELQAEAWPFANHEAFKAALASPPYLCGAGPNNSFKPKPLRGSA